MLGSLWKPPPTAPAEAGILFECMERIKDALNKESDQDKCSLTAGYYLDAGVTLYVG